MTDTPDEAVPQGLADLPLPARRRLDEAWQQEMGDGLTRRHLANATYEQLYLAAQFARALRVGRTLAATILGG